MRRRRITVMPAKAGITGNIINDAGRLISFHLMPANAGIRDFAGKISV